MARASHMRTVLSEFGANSVSALGGRRVRSAERPYRHCASQELARRRRDHRVAPRVVDGAEGTLFLLAFPQTYISAANTAVDAVAWWRACFVFMALVGLHLTYIGWTPAPSRPTTQAARSTPDLPRAA